MTPTVTTAPRPLCPACSKACKANWNKTRERRMSGRGGFPSTWTVLVNTTVRSYGYMGSGYCSKACLKTKATVTS